jgi:ferredoxin
MTDGVTPTPTLPRKGGGSLAALSASLAAHGLILRGGFHPDSEEPGLEATGTLLPVGNAGPAMWEAFAPHIDGAPDPLDRWTKRVIDPIAARFGARAVYPFGSDALPFQRWAERAETLYRSPLGILIHPEYGLWHAYRAALLFAEHLPLPPRLAAPSPCDSCAERPCLSACPVGAFTGSAYDVPLCAGHLASRDDDGRPADCLTLGCHARNACPIGADWRYPKAQIRFHMAAFARSVAGLSQA